jgi:hypothetical protein
MHRIRKHILLTIGRDLTRLYGERRLSARLQAATEQSAEALIGIQQVRRDLKKLKNIIHTITETGRERAEAEGGEDDEWADTRRRRRKSTKRIAPILNLLPPETITEYFGTQDHEAIRQALNTDKEHRNRVVDWLDASITTQVEGEIKEMNKKAQTLKIQEAY